MVGDSRSRNYIDWISKSNELIYQGPSYTPRKSFPVALGSQSLAGQREYLGKFHGYPVDSYSCQAKRFRTLSSMYHAEVTVALGNRQVNPILLVACLLQRPSRRPCIAIKEPDTYFDVAAYSTVSRLEPARFWIVAPIPVSSELHLHRLID